MTPTQFRAWRKRLGLTQAGAAAALGMSLAHVKRLEGGHPISRVIELACWAIEHGPRTELQPRTA